MELVKPLTKKQQRLEGRRRTIEMFKATYGALHQGTFQGQYGEHVGECLKFVQMLISENEKQLQKEDPKSTPEEVPSEQQETAE